VADNTVYKYVDTIQNGDPDYRLSYQREQLSGQMTCMLRLNHDKFGPDHARAYIRNVSAPELTLQFKEYHVLPGGDICVFFLIPKDCELFSVYYGKHADEMKRDYLLWLKRFSKILEISPDVFLSADLLFARPSDKTIMYMPIPGFVKPRKTYCGWRLKTAGASPGQTGAYTAAAFLLYLFGIESPNLFDPDKLPKDIQQILLDSISEADVKRPDTAASFIKRLENASSRRAEPETADEPEPDFLPDRYDVIKKVLKQWSAIAGGLMKGMLRNLAGKHRTREADQKKPDEF
jgi:hypothetical protein